MSDLQSLSTKSFAENCLVGGDEGLKKSIRLSRKTPLLGAVCVCAVLCRQTATVAMSGLAITIYCQVATRARVHTHLHVYLFKKHVRCVQPHDDLSLCNIALGVVDVTV